MDGSSQVQPLDPLTMLLPYRSYQKDSVRPPVPGRDCNPKEEEIFPGLGDLLPPPLAAQQMNFKAKPTHSAWREDSQISSHSDAGSKKIICSRIISQMNL